METKICTVCGEEKPLTEYYTKLNRGKPYNVAQCKVCQCLYTKDHTKKHPEAHRRNNAKYAKTHRHVAQKAWKKWTQVNPNGIREHKLKSIYGLTLQDYQDLLTGQQGKCAICGTTDTSPHPNFCVDHSHATSKIRGLLCQGCNSTLGWAKDRIEVLESAIVYLNQDLDKNPTYRNRWASRKNHYADMLETQDCKCLICGLESQKLYIDHDHVTDKIRGLLCRDCNLMLGHAQDNPDILREAANYLEANK